MAFATPNVGKSKYTGYTYEGKDIVLTKVRGRKVKQAHHMREWYPDDKKVEVATMYAVTRNITQTSQFTDVSQAIIRKWKQEPWFANIVSRVIKENNDILDASITDIIADCAKEIKERLTNGDVRGVNFKTGEHYKTPVDSRTLATVMGILFDKRQLLRGEATTRTETVSFDKRLEDLKEAFVKFSKASTVEGEVIHDESVQQEEPQREEAGQKPTPLLIQEMPLEGTTLPHAASDKEGIQSGIGEGQEPLQRQPDAS